MHAGARANSGVAEYEHSAARHVETDHVAGLAANRDQPCFHQQADFVSCVAIDNDRSASHSLCGAAIGRAYLVARLALNVNQPATHFAADPVTGIAFDMNLAAAELAAEMPAGGTVNVDWPDPHVGADPVDAGKIAFEVESFVAGVAGHREHFGKRDFAIAVKNLESLDLGQRLVPRPVGSEAFDFDGQRSFATIGKRNRHGRVAQVG